MTKISILFPNNKGSRFDLHYYTGTHLPLLIELLRTHPGFKGVSIERGFRRAERGTDAAYVATCNFLFDSIGDFIAALMPHAARLRSDRPNYTDIKPVMQVSEVPQL